MKRSLILVLCAASLFALVAAAQQSSPRATLPPPSKAQSTEFLKAADDVMAEMSQLLSLPVLSPLKKSIRSQEEIRNFLIQQFKEDKEPEKRYADQKVLEKFGLIPKGFPLEQFLLDVLTEQIAGLYDPKSQEFFIAESVDPAEQRTVMAHELTHALQDQHYHIEKWEEAAKPNDDAEMARESVLEGSAIMAMVDYEARKMGMNVKDMPDIRALLKKEMFGESETSPVLSHAPQFLQDELIFPYIDGGRFTQKVLQANSGWADFSKVFQNPPTSTHQILHPELYLKGADAEKVILPDLSKLLPPEWKKLDENLMGEFGLLEALKRYVEEDRAASIAAYWAGDRYAILENQKDKSLLLVFRLRLAGEMQAARFFGNYSDALDRKYEHISGRLRRPNYFSFQTDEGGVFLRCVGDQCLSAEGTDQATFEKMTHAIGWPPGPAVSPDKEKSSIAATARIGSGSRPTLEPVLTR